MHITVACYWNLTWRSKFIFFTQRTDINGRRIDNFGLGIYCCYPMQLLFWFSIILVTLYVYNTPYLMYSCKIVNVCLCTKNVLNFQNCFHAIGSASAAKIFYILQIYCKQLLKQCHRHWNWIYPTLVLLKFHCENYRFVKTWNVI